MLTSWNALAIAGLARAARALDQPRWADLALEATDALRRTVRRDGRLLATRFGEHADLNGYLDDYAFLLAALVELLQTRFRLEDFAWARELADALLANFEDREQGGFFFTSHDHEKLFHRTKPGPDNATPSGNGVAACALIAYGHLAAEPRYVAAAERCVALFAPMLADSPGGCSTLLGALADLQVPPTVVLIDGAAGEALEWQRALENGLPAFCSRLQHRGRLAAATGAREGCATRRRCRRMGLQGNALPAGGHHACGAYARACIIGITHGGSALAVTFPRGCFCRQAPKYFTYPENR